MSGDDIKVGDEIQFYPRDFRSHHAAYCIVTKVKRRTFDCTEQKGSYRQGKKWNIHKDSNFSFVTLREDGRIKTSLNSNYDR